MQPKLIVANTKAKKNGYHAQNNKNAFTFTLHTILHSMLVNINSLMTSKLKCHGQNLKNQTQKTGRKPEVEIGSCAH